MSTNKRKSAYGCSYQSKKKTGIGESYQVAGRATHSNSVLTEILTLWSGKQRPGGAK